MSEPRDPITCHPSKMDEKAAEERNAAALLTAASSDLDDATVLISGDTPRGCPAHSVPGAEPSDPPAVDPKPVSEEKDGVQNSQESPVSSQTDSPPEKRLSKPVTQEQPDRQRPKALTNEEVTNHTASLWKYLPVPENEPEPVPEYINGTVKFPGSRIIGARVRGKKHKHEGSNCDDWYEVANYGRITFLIVSDGAGSKKFSRIGARESCKAAAGYLVSAFEKLFTENSSMKENLMFPLSDPKCMEACGYLAAAVQQSVIKAHEAVEAAFYSRKTDPEYEKVLGRGLQFKDLSGTLLVAVLIPVSETTKEHLVISCQIGDGMIVILNSEGEFSNSMKLMGVPDSGDFSGETDFLTSSQMKNVETLQHRTMISRTIVDTVMVMSDGVADDYFPNETEMRRLYFDLVVNGILERHPTGISMSALTQDQRKLFKRIPDPLVYPWVNDQSVKVPIQYTNRIMEAAGLTLEDIWKDPTVLGLARLELEETENITDPSERLKIWLDNYVERGSFDDRTLVVATM